ncbi:hypothetical protein CRYUN_Cryun29cG0061600 [Craigia yunnanensis]
MVSAMIFASEMGFTNVEFEGDALAVIRKMQGGDTDFSPIGNVIEEARNRVFMFQKCCFMHVGRKGNEVANRLAKYGLGISDDIIWVEECPSFLMRGMTFVKEVRKQLSQIMQKITKGSLDVRANRSRKGDQNYRNLRKALCIGYASQLAERTRHHNGYRTLGFKSQLVLVHPSSVLRPDDDGLYANYGVYHELIATSRPYMRNVCAVERQWVIPILEKLEKLNVSKLSGGGLGHAEEGTEGNMSTCQKGKLILLQLPKSVKAALDCRIKELYGLKKRVETVGNTRSLTKLDMELNNALPNITVDPETYIVTVDGEILTCAAATTFPVSE